MHGGDIYSAARELGVDPAEILDFSASINPLGTSPDVWKAITDARHLLGHYPDPACLDLRQALAERWRIDPDQIVVGNGSTELIDAIPRALRIHRLLLIQPTFSEYAAAMERAGGCVTAVYAERQEQYAVPIDRLCRLIETRRSEGGLFDGLVLCHPNSPTGQACSADDVARLANLAHRHGLWLVVDEAFADYCLELSVLPQAASWPHVVVLRSMTKFYALPGLRVGYAVARPAVARRLQRQLPSWSINVMGQVAALAALNDTAHARKSVQFMVKERQRFAAALMALPGCAVAPACANYLFVELPRGWHARHVTERLRHDGILIRDCSSVPGSHARAIRLAVRTQQENDRLIQALSKVFQETHDA
jgi:threonine-phosphate decarboxylase